MTVRRTNLGAHVIEPLFVIDSESLETTARQKDRLGRSSIDHKVCKLSPSEGERLQFHSETIERKI